VSIVIGVSVDGPRIPVSRTRVADIARAVLRSEEVRDATLSVTFVGNRVIRTLNRKHLRRDRLTDVIAFGFRPAGKHASVVGDIYIASDVARKSARAIGIPTLEEIARLVVHGTLHVLGYDHPESGARTRSAMWLIQERLVARLVARLARATK